MISGYRFLRRRRWIKSKRDPKREETSTRARAACLHEDGNIKCGECEEATSNHTKILTNSWRCSCRNRRQMHSETTIVYSTCAGIQERNNLFFTSERGGLTLAVINYLLFYIQNSFSTEDCCCHVIIAAKRISIST